MIRIKVIVEGATEEAFLKSLVAPALAIRQIIMTPIILGATGHKGGNVNYARVRKDILLQLKQDRTAYCSTMFDLYGLGPGFPGAPFPANLVAVEKAKYIENAISADITDALPDLRTGVRFIPYLQVHEYEALLFSNPELFAASLGKPSLFRSLQSIRHTFESPEDINDASATAPSKRILRLYPGYQKIIEGTTAALKIGLDRMRLECAHFHEWISRLERLVPL